MAKLIHGIGHPLRATKAGMGTAWLPIRGGSVRAPFYWLVLFGLLSGVTVPAQEALHNSLAGVAAAKSRSQQMQNSDYTYKNGDFRMLVTPSMRAEWNDNVNLSQTNLWDDYILTPAVGIVASYPLTQRNILSLDVNVGYSRYLNHPSLSTFTINSHTGTGLSFDIGIKDVTLNLHDWINYTQDASQNATVANTANYGTFQNTIGLSADWDLNQVTLSAGYDHQNVMSTSAEFNNMNHSSEMFFIRSGLQVHPQVTLGLETTASLTTYSKTGSSNSANGLNDNNAYTVGPYMTFMASEFLDVTARGGFSTYQFKQSSQAMATSDQSTWYAGLTVNHRLREAVTYSLSAGRESQLGTQSDLTEDWYVRPSINWKIIKGWDFSTGFSYQHGKQGVGSSNLIVPTVINNVGEKYDWYSGSLDLQHALTDRFSISLNYRITYRSSNQSNDSYTQNLVGLQLNYHPQ